MLLYTANIPWEILKTMAFQWKRDKNWVQSVENDEIKAEAEDVSVFRIG